MRGLTWMIASILLGAGGVSAQAQDPLDATAVRRLELTEVTRVGGDDLREAYMFDRIRDAAVLGPEAFVVLDGGSSEARMYGLDGVIRGTLGGKGQGPGEFTSAGRMGVLPGGRLMIWDGQPQRATVFGPDGGVESTATVDLGPMAVFFAGFVGALSDGSWIQRIERNPLELRDEPEGPRRDTVVFRHVSADGELLESTARILGPRRVLVKYDRTSWVREPPILGRDLVSVVKGDTLLVALTDSLRVLRFLPDGTAVPSLRLTRPVHPADRSLTAAVRAELVAKAEVSGARASGAVLPGMSALAQGRVESLKKRLAEATIPAFSRLLVGGDGTIWVCDYRLPGQPLVERWFRMGSAFRPDGWVEVPGEGRLVAAGYGLMVTVVTDDLDVENVVVYRAR